jgi:hypothetical protein
VGNHLLDLVPEEESAPDGRYGIESRDDPSKSIKFKNSIHQRKNRHHQKMNLHLINFLEIILADYQIKFEDFINSNSMI